MPEGLSPGIAQNLLDRGHGDGLLRLRGDGGDVRQHQAVVQAQQRLRRAHRLRREDVGGRGIDRPALQRVVQRPFVDHPATGQVQQDGGRLHRCELPRPDQVPGLLVQRNVERDDVALLEQRAEVDQRQRQIGEAAGGGSGVVGEHAHSERGHPPDHFPADPAHADDPEGLAGQLVAQEAQAVGRSGMAGGRGRNQPPRRGNHEADGVLGNRDGVHPRGVGDDDAPTGGVVDVDVAVAGSVSCDEAKPGRRVDDLGVDGDRVGLAEDDVDLGDATPQLFRRHVFVAHVDPRTAGEKRLGLRVHRLGHVNGYPGRSGFMRRISHGRHPVIRPCDRCRSAGRPTSPGSCGANPRSGAVLPGIREW